MPAIEISLSDEMQKFVEQEIIEGGYASPSEFFQALIRNQQHRRAAEKFEALIQEGLQSAPGIEATPAYWDNIKAEFLAAHPASHPSK